MFKLASQLTHIMSKPVIRPLIICGPSGVGKGTLINKLLEEFPKKFGFSVSHTTRKPRQGEIDGVHYHFTNVESMKKEIDNHQFLEHAWVHGNLYGTSVQVFTFEKLLFNIVGCEKCTREGIVLCY